MICAGVSSSIKQVTCSVPQGSVAGPLLCFIVDGRFCRFVSQAWSDVVFCIHYKFHNMAQSMNVLGRCIQDIGHSMSANRLKLNPDKSKLLWTGKRHILGRLTDGGPRLVLGTKVIDASISAGLFGVTFMPELCLKKNALIVSGRLFILATPVATCTTFIRLGSGFDAHTFILLQPG